jgi:MFS family permease
MFAPLYLLMRDELGLSGVWPAAALVTVYGVVYFGMSYPAGMLADRFSRKLLLAIGLAGNSLAIFGMGMTNSYPLLLALAVCAGVFGTLFHPSANSLVSALYPKAPGMAMGLLGAGAGVGFFAGPQFAGWRAETDLLAWSLPASIGQISNWQRPCIELGIAGLIAALLFYVLAKDAPRLKPANTSPMHMSRKLFRQVLAVAVALLPRDFAWGGMIVLTSVYLQKAHGMGPKQVGFLLGGMMLWSTIANPLTIALTHGKRRLPAMATTMVLAGMGIAAIPWTPVAWVLITLSLYQIFALGSVALTDASVVERVPAEVRGRAVGVQLSVLGAIGSTSTWGMGAIVDRMGTRLADPAAYVVPFAVLGGMFAVATIAVPLMGRIGRADKSAPVLAEATVEPHAAA